MTLREQYTPGAASDEIDQAAVAAAGVIHHCEVPFC